MFFIPLCGKSDVGASGLGMVRVILRAKNRVKALFLSYVRGGMIT